MIRTGGVGTVEGCTKLQWRHNLSIRHQHAGALFAVELILGGFLPLALLAATLRHFRSALLAAGALVCALGVVFNRINVVLWAMDLKGPMPQNAPAPYAPSVVEWGISIGLIAAAIFLFGLGARLLPVLPEESAGQET